MKVKIDYQEYQDMLAVIEKQSILIEEYTKSDEPVIVDNRFEYKRYSYHNWSARIPKIMHAKKGKEYLQNEFDELYARADELEREVIAMRAHPLDQKPAQAKTSSDGFTGWLRKFFEL